MVRVADLGGVSPALSAYAASLRWLCRGNNGMGVSGPNEKWAHRKFDAEKTARGGADGWRRFPFCDLRSSAHLHNEVGKGPAVAGGPEACGPHQHHHYN